MALTDAQKHHWSGWPGAFCFKCHREDHREIALATGDLDFAETPGDHPEDEPTVDIVYKSPEVEARLKELDECLVYGVLVWNKDTGKFDLDATVKPTEEPRPA